jgi:hypothetical protein
MNKDILIFNFPLCVCVLSKVLKLEFKLSFFFVYKSLNFESMTFFLGHFSLLSFELLGQFILKLNDTCNTHYMKVLC